MDLAAVFACFIVMVACLEAGFRMKAPVMALLPSTVILGCPDFVLSFFAIYRILSFAIAGCNGGGR